MSEKLKESLSAVIDGEADEFELRRVLDEIGKDETLTASWERYHMIGAAMRREPVQDSVMMRERVWAEVRAGGDVQAAPMVDVPEAAAVGHATRTGLSRWTGVAVAATVALAVVIGFSLPGGSDPASVELADSGVDTTVASQEAAIDLAVGLNAEATDLDQQRVDAYMVRHLQNRGMNGPGIEFAKMVSYERR
ncbi:MAG: sigma-E factor negative regulatory protein [Pseudomonadota bacterium]